MLQVVSLENLARFLHCFFLSRFQSYSSNSTTEVRWLWNTSVRRTTSYLSDLCPARYSYNHATAVVLTLTFSGSEAESARIIVGDFVTEVNGHDCRKGVGISRVMELKTLIQQTSIEKEESTVDVSS